jgi:hypothetical protein
MFDEQAGISGAVNTLGSALCLSVGDRPSVSHLVPGLDRRGCTSYEMLPKWPPISYIVHYF